MTKRKYKCIKITFSSSFSDTIHYIKSILNNGINIRCDESNKTCLYACVKNKDTVL